MVGPVESGQDSGSAVNLLEVVEVVPGPEVHAPLAVRPVIRLRTREEDHGVDERGAQLVDGAVFLREIREERGEVALAGIAVAYQLVKGNPGNLPRKGSRPQPQTGDVLGNGICDGAADQVHLADELDARLRLFLEREDEAQDITGVGEGDDDDVPGVGDLVAEDDLLDARPDELAGSPLLAPGKSAHVPGGRREGPEIAVVVLENVHADEAFEGEIDDLLGAGSEPLDPELGVPLLGFVGDLLEARVEDRVAGGGLVEEDEGVHVGVDAADQGEFREHGADDGAVQVPAGYLAKVATLLVEEHED